MNFSGTSKDTAGKKTSVRPVSENQSPNATRKHINILCNCPSEEEMAEFADAEGPMCQRVPDEQKNYTKSKTSGTAQPPLSETEFSDARYCNHILQRNDGETLIENDFCALNGTVNDVNIGAFRNVPDYPQRFFQNSELSGSSKTSEALQNTVRSNQCKTDQHNDMHQNVQLPSDTKKSTSQDSDRSLQYSLIYPSHDGQWPYPCNVKGVPHEICDDCGAIQIASHGYRYISSNISQDLDSNVSQEQLKQPEFQKQSTTNRAVKTPFSATVEVQNCSNCDNNNQEDSVDILNIVVSLCNFD